HVRGARAMRRLLILVVASALAVVGSACGSSSTGSSSSKTSATSGSSSTQAGGTAAADMTVAQQINLQAGDFPPGWQSQPATPSGSGNAGTRQLLSCIGASPSLATTTTNVDS